MQNIHSEFMSKEKLLELTAYAESYSKHPISLSLKRAYGKEIDNTAIADVEEIPGYGVRAVVHGTRVLAGNRKLMEKINIPYFKGEIIGTVVHVAINGKYAGYIEIADEIKEDAPVLARDDIGIAMGGLGSDAAIEAADVVIMTDEPSKIVVAMKISKRTLRIAKQNVFFALSVKAIVLIMGAIGMASMWASGFANLKMSREKGMAVSVYS